MSNRHEDEMSLEDFTHLILPIKNKLFRFSLRIVGNVAEAEDVVQEVFIKVWNKRNDLANYSNVEAWCMTLTKNLSIDKIRSKHRRADSFKEGFDVPSSNNDNPYHQTAYNDTFDRVQKLLNDLPEKQRMVMQLRDIEGLAYQEIADALNISLQQVKVNLFRARQQIRVQLVNTESYGL
jgi:RNA polymerase sigma-70 factor (ECF subfamily)